MNKNEKVIYVVVPVYNERRMIARVIKSLQAQLFQNIILVDDGSQENLLPEVAHLGVHYLKHVVNLGQGAALQTGVQYALLQGASIIITFDADGQHNATDLKRLVAPISENNADVILGSRFLNGGATQVPIVRKTVLQVARLVNFMLTGLWLTDAHNGLRAFSREAAQRIIIAQNRMAHATEIIAELRTHRLRITEVPVTISYTRYARQKGQKNSDALKILFDLVLYKLFK